MTIPDPPGEPLRAGIWYPTTESDRSLNLFTQHVALDEPVEGSGHPLVVLSHGNGGSLDNHSDTALALVQAVVVAPALGLAFAPDGLRAVHIPVQLWRAGDDPILPSPDYAEAVREALPQPPEYHVVPGADHFDVLAPCSEMLAHYVPTICQEHGDFDRAAFHRAFDSEIVRFFQQTLR